MGHPEGMSLQIVCDIRLLNNYTFSPFKHPKDLPRQSDPILSVFEMKKCSINNRRLKCYTFGHL